MNLIFPFLAILLTLFLYIFSLRLHNRYRWVNPLAFASIALALLLYILRIPYSQYQEGGNLITQLLGPATVALGVPLYKHAAKLKKQLIPLFIITLTGSAIGLLTAGGFAWLFGASQEGIFSVLPKSVTTPIAVEISKNLQGDPSITAGLVMIAGFLGSIFGLKILAWSRIHNEYATGAAIGTASHALGTAMLFRRSELEGSVSSLAMAMTGVLTSILVSVFIWWFH